MTIQCDVGIIGLGVMGASFARNFLSRGWQVAGYNRTVSVAEAMAGESPRFVAAHDLPELVAVLKRPRRIVLLVPAGAPVDNTLAQLGPLLEAGDLVVDAGNSYYLDTGRRLQMAEGLPWAFVGMGLSGGEEGALKGPALMVGGQPEHYAQLKELLTSVAATGEMGPCVGYCGTGAAGHFVKMVHNGIEYGDMQLIAESVRVLRKGLGMSAHQAAEVFRSWRDRELDSYLIDITADVLDTLDPKHPGESVVDAILDQAGQKGTGKWTVMAAAELGVTVPTLAAALDARIVSAQAALRTQAAARFASPLTAPFTLDVKSVAAALYAAKLVSYAQGFLLLQQASQQYGYGTDLAEVARVWTAGCIIRARFLGQIVKTYTEKPDLPLLILSPAFAQALEERLPALRQVVGQSLLAGLPVPAFSASLAWIDLLSRGAGMASLIQAQRDYFGGHTFEWLDQPGQPVHLDWKAAQHRG